MSNFKGTVNWYWSHTIVHDFTPCEIINKTVILQQFIMCTIKTTDHGQNPSNNVWVIAMFFLLYNVCIEQSECIWYAVEQYDEKTDQNVDISIIGFGPSTVLHL